MESTETAVQKLQEDLSRKYAYLNEHIKSEFDNLKLFKDRINSEIEVLHNKGEDDEDSQNSKTDLEMNPLAKDIHIVMEQVSSLKERLNEVEDSFKSAKLSTLKRVRGCETNVEEMIKTFKVAGIDQIKASDVN